MGRSWGVHGALETPQLPQNLHTPSLRRGLQALLASLLPTRKMAKPVTWPKQRLWAATPSKDPTDHPRLVASGKSQKEQGFLGTFSPSSPTHTGLRSPGVAQGAHLLGGARPHPHVKAGSADSGPEPAETVPQPPSAHVQHCASYTSGTLGTGHYCHPPARGTLHPTHATGGSPLHGHS